MKKIITKNIIICLALIFFSVFYQGTVLAADSVSLLLQPSTRTVQVNDTLDVDIIFNAGHNRVLGLSFEVDFDKAKLNLTGSNFDTQPNNGFTATNLIPSNSQGFFQYYAIGDLSNVASGDVKLGTLHFKAIAQTDTEASKAVTFPAAKIIAGSADTPILTVGSNQNGTYTINPGTNTSCPATITSTQVRGRLHGSSGAWSTTPTITEGQTLDVAGFHNNNTSSPASDTTLTYTGPEGSTSSTQDISTVVPTHIGGITPSRGTYTLTAQVPGATGINVNNCRGSATLTVNPAPIVTTKYRIAESPADLDRNAVVTPWRDYTDAQAAPNSVTYTFKDQTPGQKFIFVQFKDSTGRVTTTTDCPDCQVAIRLLGPDPTVTSCSLAFEGSSTILNIVGTHFGIDKGTAVSGDTSFTPAQIRSWKDTNVQIVWPNAPNGQVLPVTITNPLGQSADSQCGAVSALSIGAKFFCRQPALHQMDNVDLTLVEAFAGGSKFKQTVTIDKDGIVQGLTRKLESGKDYVLSIKAPKSIRKNAPFRAGEGVTNIPNFVLWVGDIFPADGGDGRINSLDKQELNRQWNIISEVKGRSGDFNQDSRVNSIDWACMRVSMVDSAGRSDDPEPVSGVQSSPVPSPSPASSSSPSPSPSVSPSPSPSSSSSPSPSP